MKRNIIKHQMLSVALEIVLNYYDHRKKYPLIDPLFLAFDSSYQIMPPSLSELIVLENLFFSFYRDYLLMHPQQFPTILTICKNDIAMRITFPKNITSIKLSN
jgi:hypothetical protein